MKTKAVIGVIALVCSMMLGVWSVSANVQAQLPTLAAPVAVVNVSFLNLRSGPGPQYSVISQLVGGTTVPVIGANSDSSWLLVDTPIGAGWVYAQFTLPRGNFQFVPSLDAPPVLGGLLGTPAFYIGLGDPAAVPATTITVAEPILLPVPVLASPTVVVNTSFLNIRSGPAGYFGVVAVAVGGEQFTPLGITSDGEWFLIEGAFGRGWIDQDFVLFRGVIDNVPIVFAY